LCASFSCGFGKDAVEGMALLARGDSGEAGTDLGLVLAGDDIKNGWAESDGEGAKEG
jgi:hypothetical protein